MRYAILCALFALAACSVESSKTGETAPPAGYTLEVFAHADEQIYLVSHEDGRAAAARAAHEQSATLSADEARGLLAERQSAFAEPSGEGVSIRAPGFQLSIDGEDAGESGNDESVRISMNTGGGSFTLDAEDGGEGNEGRARVRITGANEDTARDFIQDAEELSPEVKTQMLQSLGL